MFIEVLLFVNLFQKWAYELMFAFSWSQISLFVWVKVTEYFFNSTFYLIDRLLVTEKTFNSSFHLKYSFTKAASKYKPNTMFRGVTVRGLFQLLRTQALFKWYQFDPLYSNFLPQHTEKNYIPLMQMRKLKTFHSITILCNSNNRDNARTIFMQWYHCVNKKYVS